MEHVLAVELGDLVVRSAVIDSEGIRGSLTEVVGVSSQIDQLDWVKSALLKTGLPGDTHAIVIADQVVNNRIESLRGGVERRVLPADRIAEALGRPVTLVGKVDALAVASIGASPAENQPLTAFCWLAGSPRYALVANGTLVQSARPCRQLRSGPDRSIGSGSDAVVRDRMHFASEAAMSVVEQHGPDALVLAGLDEGSLGLVRHQLGGVLKTGRHVDVSVEVSRAHTSRRSVLEAAARWVRRSARDATVR